LPEEEKQIFFDLKLAIDNKSAYQALWAMRSLIKVQTIRNHLQSRAILNYLQSQTIYNHLQSQAIFNHLQSSRRYFADKGIDEIINIAKSGIKEILGHDWQYDDSDYSDKYIDELMSLNWEGCEKRWRFSDDMDSLELVNPDGSINSDESIDEHMPLDRKGIKVVKNLINFLSCSKIDVEVRPKFFEYCGDNGRYKFDYFSTPMDYLQQIIDDDVPVKNHTQTVDITKIIPKPDSRKADNYQLPKIIDICERANANIEILRSNQTIPDEIKYVRIREAEDEVIQNLKKWKINDNTIRIILYRAFSANKKYHNDDYSKMRRHLAGWLYQSHPETFEQVIEMSKSND
jgi:hypothetical protein